MSRTLLGLAAATLLGAGALMLRPPREGTPSLDLTPAPATAALPGLLGNAEAGAPAPFPPATTPAQVRGVVRAARNATAADAPELRRLALNAPDPLVAGNAIRALGRLGRLGRLDPEPELLALLDDPRPRVQQELVLALGQPGGTAALPLLARVLRREDKTLRCLALLAIGRIGGDEAGAMLAQVAANPAVGGDERSLARVARR